MNYTMRTLPIVMDDTTAARLSEAEGLRPFGRPGFRYGDIVQHGMPGWYQMVIVEPFWSIEMREQSVYLVDDCGLVIAKATGDSLSNPADYRLKATFEPYPLASTPHRVLLPLRMSYDGAGYEAAAVLQAWGIWPDPAPAPAGWWFATLPPGWSLQVLDRQLNLVDAGGRLRGDVRYKTGELVLHNRLRLSDSFNLGSHDKVTYSVVNTDDVRLYTDPMETEDDAEADAKHYARQAWLNYHFPDWQNPLAYWDDDCRTWTHRFVPGLCT